MKPPHVGTSQIPSPLHRQEDLHLLYTAGTCQGRLCFARRSAAPRGAATAAADFVPRLQRPPETVLVQSWKAEGSRLDGSVEWLRSDSVTIFLSKVPLRKSG